MARKNPLVSEVPKMDKHEQMASEMHDALYSLQDRIRKPYPRNGEKLLPKNLRSKEPEDAKAARKHLKRLHRAMREEK